MAEPSRLATRGPSRSDLARSVGRESIYASTMNVVAAPSVQEFVREHGGCLYVWTDRTLCCGGSMTFLKNSTTRPGTERAFREIANEDFRLLLDPGLHEPPDELHLVLKGWYRKRVEAFWNGCALVEVGIHSSPRVAPQAARHSATGALPPG
jgi:hypothetical protein